MLTLYRRHKPTCSHFAKGRKHLHCKCAIWADGVLGREEIRRSMKTRDWTKANQEVQKWEAAERVNERGAPVSLADAWESMLADLEARQVSPSTLGKYKLLKRQLAAYAESRGLSHLADFDLETLSRFRATWKDGPRTAAKKLERLRAFFRYATERRWTETNPAALLRPPKVSLRPTMPLEHGELVKILAACEKREDEVQGHGYRNAQRLKTLVLLLRYSGMRISDAVALSADRLQGSKLFLYTQKTGVPVYTVLPDFVIEALEATPHVTAKLFFWSGNGKLETAVKDWQGRLRDIFEDAEVSKGDGNAVAHRFRDTFAVSLLLAGVPIERVSILLGHQSVRITEKHYNPWVRSRQEQLEADVRLAWSKEPPIITGTNRVQAQGPVN
jgi:integrase/recombinase XerD